MWAVLCILMSALHTRGFGSSRALAAVQECRACALWVLLLPPCARGLRMGTKGCMSLPWVCRCVQAGARARPVNPAAFVTCCVLCLTLVFVAGSSSSLNTTLPSTSAWSSIRASNYNVSLSSTAQSTSGDVCLYCSGSFPLTGFRRILSVNRSSAEVSSAW